jgi:hypothetical protein
VGLGQRVGVCGKDAELIGDREDQKTSMLALHLLQAVRVHLTRSSGSASWRTRVGGWLTDAAWRLAGRPDGARWARLAR